MVQQTGSPQIELGSGAERTIVLDSDQPAAVEGLSLDDITRDEHAAIGRLVDVHGIPGRRIILLRRNRRYRVGRVRFRDMVITVPPDLRPELFVDLLLYAYGVDLEKLTPRPAALVDLAPTIGRDVFLTLIAYLLVEATERLLTRRIARTYENIEERMAVLRGRPRWTADFGHHPIEGITCRYHSLRTDNLLNRLVFSGLLAAGSLLQETRWSPQCQSQVFIWRSIASEVVPRPADFLVAERGIDRLTENYRPVLALSRALVLGFSPEDVFSGMSTPFQTLEFSLPLLFERFAFRILRQAGAELDLDVRYRESDPEAILDGLGQGYRRVEPDIVLFRGGRAVGVVDAKYKPRYVAGLPAKPIPPQDRVSNADIYQLFF